MRFKEMYEKENQNVIIQESENKLQRMWIEKSLEVLNETIERVACLKSEMMEVVDLTDEQKFKMAFLDEIVRRSSYQVTQLLYIYQVKGGNL